MPTTALLRRAFLDRGLLGSLLLHILLGIVLSASPLRSAIGLAAERVIDVQIVTEPGPARQAAPDPVSPPPSPEPPRLPSLPPSARSEPASATPEPPAFPLRVPETVTPKTMLSGRILAGPHGRDERSFLQGLTGDARTEQLCDVEAMAQIGAWNRTFQPDRLMAYAIADPKMTDLALVADGAAFHSKGQWFNVRFRCALASDRSRVVSLDFSVGAAIPKAEWPAHNLPFEGGGRD